MSAFVYRFLVLDEDAERRTFECRAADDADADRQVAAAGIREVALYEVVRVDRRLRTGALTARLRHHPFLGPEWEPIVELLHEATEGLDSGGFWRIQVVPPVAAEGGSAPFAQAMKRPDGATQVEVGGAPVAEGLDRRRRAELDFFGWEPPQPDEGLPLPYVVLDAEWSGRAVAQRVLEALAVVYDMGPAHRLAFEGTARDLAASGRFGLVAAGEGVYALGGEGEVAGEVADGAADAGAAVAGGTAAERVAARSAGLALPDTVGYEAAETLTLLLDDVDLSYPYIPTHLGPVVDSLLWPTFGTFRRPFAPEALHDVEGLLARLMEGDWLPRLRFGPIQPGERSLATYELVQPSLAVVIQVPDVLDAGEAAAQRRADWAQAMTRTRALSNAYRGDPGATARDGIIVLVWSPAIAGVKLLTWDDIPRHGETPDAFARFARKPGARRPSLATIFDAAERWLHRGES